MLLLLFFLSFSSELCHSQVLYSPVVPYDPRYVLHRPPVRRSAMEALERLRLPVARYFPQVDTQVAAAPYQGPVPPVSEYQLSADDLYAQWPEQFVQSYPERPEEEDPYRADYDDYESAAFSPVYRHGVYPEAPAYVEFQEPPADQETPNSQQLYNEIMANYLLGGAEPVDNLEQADQYNVQRRSDSVGGRNQGVITLSTVFQSSKNETKSPNMEATLAPPSPLPSKPTPQVRVTAVPNAPEKKEIKSLIIPEPVPMTEQEREEASKSVGQKEEPLFRPLQNSQKTTWDVLTRAKNSMQKVRPIPLLKQMIQNGQRKVIDPLTEELNSLKKEHGV